MLRSAKTRAEAQFTATQKKSEKALKEKEKLRQDRADQLARLRALRLAKEAADKQAEDQVEAEKNKAAAEKSQAAADKKQAAADKKRSEADKKQSEAAPVMPAAHRRTS